MTLFIHEPNVMSQFPRHYTGLITVKEFTDRESLLQPTVTLRQSIEAGVFKDKVSQSCAEWRQVFSQMGAKPKYTSSLESLADCFRERGKLYSINEIVDFYNHYSLCSANPMGAYDMDKLSGNLRLAFVGKGRPFSPLGNPKSPQMTKDKEVGYADDDKVTCRYWNLQDCDETKITEATQNILFMFDLLAENPEDAAGQYRQIASDFEGIFSGRSYACGLTGGGQAQEICLRKTAAIA
ncbi:MAG: phenylalanine--tRNA ligase beta subunit-related protein [Alphaproteobacteria bacterium]|nr:phenylalanine--tRNA ligase beta subunit-related protein [Alphaproteobacteria bacterium]